MWKGNLQYLAQITIQMKYREEKKGKIEKRKGIWCCTVLWSLCGVWRVVCGEWCVVCGARTSWVYTLRSTERGCWRRRYATPSPFLVSYSLLIIPSFPLLSPFSSSLSSPSSFPSHSSYYLCKHPPLFTHLTVKVFVKLYFYHLNSLLNLSYLVSVSKTSKYSPLIL